MTIGDHFVPIELLVAGGILFGILSLACIVLHIVCRKKQTEAARGIYLTARSWWYIAIGIAIVVLAPLVFGTIILAYVSFVALREMFSISGFRESDRTAIFIAYLALPVQYYLAYTNNSVLFLIFIPVVMFVAVPFVLVIAGQTYKLGRSMSFIPTLLILTVYTLSHIVMIFHIEMTGSRFGPGGLILFLILLTSLNDVSQFIWGKLLGRRKILPKVSPNKTWAGFIGGVVTTAGLALLLRFLTPLEPLSAAIVGFSLGIMGFVGDAVMSGIKRDLEIKDTDDLIPGHGGAMDRLDSIVITAPGYYYLLNYLVERS